MVRNALHYFLPPPAWMLKLALFGWVLLLGVPRLALAQSNDTHQEHRHPAEISDAKQLDLRAVALDYPVVTPAVTLLNQNGQTMEVNKVVTDERIVVINFIFTTCTTVCPPMGATFARLQKLLAEAGQTEVQLISISVDPVTDTPERLKAWAAKFGAPPARPDWTLLTGEKPEVDKLLRSLGGLTARKEDHTPMLLIGNVAQKHWVRAYGLAKPSDLFALVKQVASYKSRSNNTETDNQSNSAQKYFSDVPLLNQHGERMRFYSDLLKGRVVVINSFFTTCASVCPPMNQRLAKLQEIVGERLGKEVIFISISVDPLNDTPEKLKSYAERFHARPGWYFLTGKKENVDWALHKVGQYVEGKDDHTTVMIIGNEPKGVWIKAMGMAPVSELQKIIEDTLAEK